MSSINPFIGSSRFSLASSSGPPSEAPSSELSSVESDFSDLKSIIAGLGIVDPDEVYTERFKIDRAKLEEMIKSEFESKRFDDEMLNVNFNAAEAYNDGMNRAEFFFSTVKHILFVVFHNS